MLSPLLPVPTRHSSSNVIDVEHLADVVVLQHNFLGRYQPFAVNLSQGDEHGSEKMVVHSVAVAERAEVVAYVYFVAAFGQHFHIGDVVTGTRLRHGSTTAFSLDAEHTVFQSAAVRVIHQRNLALV